MKIAKPLLMVVTVLALAGVLAPKTAYSLVSTLVTVVNTSAQPVPVVATDAQTAFVVSNFCIFSDSPYADMCSIGPLYTVPAGKTAVIESASGACVTKPTTTTREFQLNLGTSAQLSFPPSPGVASVGASTANVNIVVSTTAQNFKSYAAPGTLISFLGLASANQTGVSFPNCVFTVSGHLVSTP